MKIDAEYEAVRQLGRSFFHDFLEKNKISHEWNDWDVNKVLEKGDFLINGKTFSVLVYRSPIPIDELDYSHPTVIVFGKGMEVDYYVNIFVERDLSKILFVGYISHEDLLKCPPVDEDIAKDMPDGVEAHMITFVDLGKMTELVKELEK